MKKYPWDESDEEADEDPLGTVILRFNGGNPGVTIAGLGFLTRREALKLAADIQEAFRSADSEEKGKAQS